MCSVKGLQSDWETKDKPHAFFADICVHICALSMDYIVSESHFRRYLLIVWSANETYIIGIEGNGRKGDKMKNWGKFLSWKKRDFTGSLIQPTLNDWSEIHYFQGVLLGKNIFWWSQSWDLIMFLSFFVHQSINQSIMGLCSFSSLKLAESWSYPGLRRWPVCLWKIFLGIPFYCHLTRKHK